MWRNDRASCVRIWAATFSLGHARTIHNSCGDKVIHLWCKDKLRVMMVLVCSSAALRAEQRSDMQALVQQRLCINKATHRPCDSWTLQTRILPLCGLCIWTEWNIIISLRFGKVKRKEFFREKLCFTDTK